MKRREEKKKRRRKKKTAKKGRETKFSRKNPKNFSLSTFHLSSFLQPQRVQQFHMVPHPRQRVGRDHAARRRRGDPYPGGAAVPDAQQTGQICSRARKCRVRRRNSWPVGASVAVEEALVGARRSRKGDHGAVPGVRDDPLDAVLFCLFEGERFFFFLGKKKKSGNLFSLSFSSPSRKKKKGTKNFFSNSPRAPASSPPSGPCTPSISDRASPRARRARCPRCRRGRRRKKKKERKKERKKGCSRPFLLPLRRRGRARGRRR